MDSTRRVTAAQQIAEDIHFADEEYNIKMRALDKELKGLDKSGKDYLIKLQQLQDKEKQVTQQHENDVMAIKDNAETAQNNKIKKSYAAFVEATSAALTQSIMGHETWAKTIQSLGDQVISGMVKNAITSAMVDDFDKERDAARAARKFFIAGSQLPFPINIVAAPVMAAGAFALVMGFEGGTDRVPGVGRGDIVPSALEPGEGVVPGGVMDGLRTMVRSGGFNGGPHHHVTMHMHISASALDAAGMDKVLDKHADTLQRHFEKTLRRMSK
jgi:hypothetical protein